MGASMDLTTQSGETAKDVARRFSQLACLKLLGGGTDKIETNASHQKTETQRRKLNPKEEERGRAKQKFEELQKQFEIAKKNFRQLGGQFEEDDKRDTVEQDSQKYYFYYLKTKFSCFFLFRKIEELDAQLAFERLKREKRESELDECRTEIARLINTLRSFEDKRLHSRVRQIKSIIKISLFFLFFSNDHQVNLINIKLKNHHVLQLNEHDVLKKKPDLYLCVEILLILN